MKRISLLDCTWSLVVVLSVVVVSGCGGAPAGPKTVSAGGKVTYQDKPVAGANVAFLGDGKIPSATGVTDANGEFKLSTANAGPGAVPGSHQVTVSKFEAINVQPAASNSMEAAAKASQAGPAAAPKSLLPEKYSNAATSGFSFTIEEGKENKFQLDLKD